jgi:hypothetical protein
LSKRGCNIDAADPAARNTSLSYDPIGSKLYTAPLPMTYKSDHEDLQNDELIINTFRVWIYVQTQYI